MLDRIKAVERFKKELDDQVPILGWIEGCFAEACDLYPMTALMMDTADRPELVVEFLERILPTEIAFAEAQIEAGAHVIGIGDSAASLVSPETFENIILPFERREVQAIHAAGAKTKLHICGSTDHLVDLMWKSGVDIIDLDHAVDMRRARRRIPTHIPICGNMDPVACLQDGTPESITIRAQEDIRVGAGSFMLAPGCEVPRHTPPQNVRAFVRAAHISK
jgi:MtaA/CmuA family methyltransferase